MYVFRTASRTGSGLPRVKRMKVRIAALTLLVALWPVVLVAKSPIARTWDERAGEIRRLFVEKRWDRAERVAERLGHDLMKEAKENDATPRALARVAAYRAAALAEMGKSDDAEWQKAINGFYERTRFLPLDARFVFAGSHFYKNPKTGEELYEGEAGDLICVANFPSAVIDLSISSSNQNDDLNYEAWTERIPEIGTTVLIDLSPAKAAEKAAVPAK